MIKIQNEKGETLYEVRDGASKPVKVILDEATVCPKCKQKGPNKPGEYPCPECGRNLLHDDEEEE